MVENKAAVQVADFRQTMGLFATGVTVLSATSAQGEPVGMTANALTSVSLEPLQLLVCVGLQANILPHIQQSDGFEISILRRDQEDLSAYFASMWPEDEAPPEFEFIPWAGGHRLGGILGAVACKTLQVIESGDHLIFIGEVTELYQADDHQDPLLFFGGGYRTLGD